MPSTQSFVKAMAATTLEQPCGDPEIDVSEELQAAWASSEVDTADEANGTHNSNARPAVHELLTLVVTTNPSPTNPLTFFIEDVIGSYLEHEPEMKACQKIIVCDGINLRTKGNDDEFRIGRVSHEAASKYESYVSALESLSAKQGHPLEGALILRMDRRRGFALALREAIQLVKTPYVMVVQHDRLALKPFFLRPILESMESFPFRFVNYVCLGTSNTYKFPAQSVERSKIDVRDYAMRIPGTNAKVVPLTFWFDSTHICRVDFYKQFCFQRQVRELNPFRSWYWKTGDFVEDKLGQLLHMRVKAGGITEFNCFGSYLLVFDDDGTLVYPGSRCSKYGINHYIDKHESCFISRPKHLRATHRVITHINQRRVQSIVRRYGDTMPLETANHDALAQSIDAERERHALLRAAAKAEDGDDDSP